MNNFHEKHYAIALLIALVCAYFLIGGIVDSIESNRKIRNAEVCSRLKGQE